LERGVPSRVYNKATARTAGREIMFWKKLIYWYYSWQYN
jgi:hypothetical protein